MSASIVRSLLLPLALCASLWGGQVAAQNATPVQQASLSAAVARFGEATESRDAKTTIDLMPPGLLQVMASDSKVEAAEFKEALAASLGKTMADLKLDGFAMDVGNAKFRELPNGRVYALIPTQTFVTAPDGAKLRADSETLALLESGKWYLASITSDAQARMLTRAYPEFSGVRFSGQKNTVLSRP